MCLSGFFSACRGECVACLPPFSSPRDASRLAVDSVSVEREDEGDEGEEEKEMSRWFSCVFFPPENNEFDT